MAHLDRCPEIFSFKITSAPVPGGNLKRGRPSATQALPDELDHPDPKQSRQQIIGHDPQPARQALLQPADRPGLEDIEAAKYQESGQDPTPSRRDEGEQKQDADDLIPDDARMVPAAETTARQITEGDAEQKHGPDQDQVQILAQMAEERIHGQADQGPHCARGMGGKTGAEAHGEEA